VKKIAVYKDKLAVQLSSKVVIYELANPDDPVDMHYQSATKIQQKLDCNLLVVTSSSVILCQVRSHMLRGRDPDVSTSSHHAQAGCGQHLLSPCTSWPWSAPPLTMHKLAVVSTSSHHAQAGRGQHLLSPCTCWPWSAPPLTMHKLAVAQGAIELHVHQQQKYKQLSHQSSWQRTRHGLVAP